MAVSADYLAYVIDQFAPFAKVVSRRMFGGIGLYTDGLFFGLIDDDTLYLKVDDSNRPDYIARGAKPFQPFADDPTYSMNYFQLPEDVLEDTEELRAWTRKSVAVAAAKALEKQAKKKKQSARSAPPTRKARAKRSKSGRASRTGR
jgi:DNA transformation protein and related proteins